MDEDLYPNEGTAFHPTIPEDRQREENEEASKAKAGIPIIEDLLKRVNKDIDEHKYISTAISESKKRNISVEQASFGLDMGNERVTAIKEYLEALIDQYK